MSKACPACGVAVVPGYVRCPKCSAPLPHGQLRRLATSAGGTSLEGSGFPLVPVVIAVAVAAVIVVVFATRGGGAKPASAGDPTDDVAAGTDDVEPPPPPTDDPTPTFTPTTRPTGPDPGAAVADLRRALSRERLWGTVEVAAPRVDVRSGACEDPNMGSVIDAATPPLRDAGLTKLRCLEQSGRVVFERDL